MAFEFCVSYCSCCFLVFRICYSTTTNIIQICLSITKNVYYSRLSVDSLQGLLIYSLYITTYNLTINKSHLIPLKLAPDLDQNFNYRINSAFVRSEGSLPFQVKPRYFSVCIACFLYRKLFVARMLECYVTPSFPRGPIYICFSHKFRFQPTYIFVLNT